MINSFLFKNKKINNNGCSYCNEHRETIEHLFLNCTKVKYFWNSLLDWLSKNCNIILHLEEKSLIFSSQKPRSIENYILCLAKYYIYIYIYKNKFTRNTLSLQNFMSLHKNKFISAKYIASIYNWFAKFLTKWSKVYNYFTNS